MKTTMRILWVPVAVSLLLIAACGGSGSDSASLPAEAETILSPIVDPGVGGSAAASFSLAVDINNEGVVVGYAETAPGSTFTAARWSVNDSGSTASAPSPLHPVSDGGFSAAFSVDEQGNAVGRASGTNGMVAVRWKAEQSSPTPLPQEGQHSSAHGISPNGRLIVGEFTNSAGTTRAVLWEAGEDGEFTTSAQVLPVTAFARGGVLSPLSSALAVNDDGWIAGVVEDGNDVPHAVLWRPDSNGVYVATDLAGSGEVGSIAYALSQTGQVVGEVELGEGGFAAVHWGSGAAEPRQNLASAGSALAINALATRAGGAAGSTPRATIWRLPTGTGTTLFSTNGAVFGINDSNLVVGFNNGKGFVARID